MNVLKILSFMLFAMVIDAMFYYVLVCVLWMDDKLRGEDTSFIQMWKDSFWNERSNKYEVSQGIFTLVWSPVYFLMATIILIINCIRKLFEPLSKKIGEWNRG